MGLQSQFNDLSSDSIPLLLVAIIANCVNYLRSSFFGLLQSVGLSRFDQHNQRVDDGLLDAVGSGLAGLIFLAEQLNLNSTYSYRFGDDRDDSVGGGCSDCVVCLHTFKHGEQVRRLACRHVFHKNCFEDWLSQLKFTCPLCRFPLLPDERVDITRRRVGEDVVAWLSSR